MKEKEKKERTEFARKKSINECCIVCRVVAMLDRFPTLSLRRTILRTYIEMIKEKKNKTLKERTECTKKTSEE